MSSRVLAACRQIAQRRAAKEDPFRLDRDPPASDQGQTFQVGYDPRYTDAHGRTLYLGLKYAFK